MARPLLDEALLKHPRKKRKSTTVATILPGIKKPTKKELNKWKPIVDMCYNAILLNEPLNTLPKRNRVQINWGQSVPPEWFPRGYYVEGKPGVLDYNPEIIMVELYKRRLSPWSPTMIYKARYQVLAAITRLENEHELKLDIT